MQNRPDVAAHLFEIDDCEADSMDATCVFYERVLGMRVIRFGEGRKALQFGDQKTIFTSVERRSNPRRQIRRQALPTFA